ncbi:MAG: M16 family metallopeptidase [Caulobacterales bacterium]|jgi:zinc protease
MRLGLMGRSWAFVLVAVLALAAPNAVAAPKPAKAPKPAAAVAAAPADKLLPAKPDFTFWPHDYSDLKPDPAVRYGVLPNGMRYAIKKNSQPKNTAALRLRIASGSIQETDAQQGLAHYLEHMAFNGSKNVAEGEMVKILERKGLAFGPDTNAYTSFGETVYMLDLPNVQKDTIDTGISLMRETADRLTISQASVERERGVILSEERSRDTPELRASKARYDLWLQGQIVARRFPIGLIETINAANREKILDYYQRFYRPERALFVVVGDVDVDAMEAQIKKTFADWSQPGAAGVDPGLGQVIKRGQQAKVLVEPKGSTQVSITYVSAPERFADTAGQRQHDLRRELAMAVVNRRLERLARADNPPFIAAGLGRFDLSRSATLANVSIQTAPDGWAKGMAASEQELRRALQYGVDQVELDREIAEMRAGYENAAISADTRETRSLAMDIVSAFDDVSVFTHPRDDFARFDAMVKGFTAAQASTLLREAFKGEGPLLFLNANQPVPGGEKALNDAFDASKKIAVLAPAKQTAKTWTYTSFGKPGAVIDRKRDAVSGVDMLRFANGVKLNVKSTDFDKDQIGVLVRLGGGQLVMPKTAPGLNWVSPFAVPEGGLGKLDREEIDRALTGKVVGLSFGVDDNAFVLSGGTRGEDLATQLQLVAASITDSAWRPQGLKRMQSFAENQFKQLEASPGRVLGRDAPAILRSGDGRWAFPTLAQAQAITMEQVKSPVAPALARAPIEVTLVGDVTLAQAEKLVAATLGALPARAADFPGPADAKTVRFAQGGGPILQLTHLGRADQSLGYIAFKGYDALGDLRKTRTQRFVAQLMRLRLTDEFRERLGASYSPSAGSQASDVFPGFGFVSASAETPPEKVTLFYQIVDQIAAELREGRFDDDLIERARKPLVEAAQNAEKTNAFWIGAIADIQTDPQTQFSLRTRISDLQTITRAELVAAAKEILQPQNAVRIRVDAKPATP